MRYTTITRPLFCMVCPFPISRRTIQDVRPCTARATTGTSWIREKKESSQPWFQALPAYMRDYMHFLICRGKCNKVRNELMNQLMCMVPSPPPYRSPVRVWGVQCPGRVSTGFSSVGQLLNNTRIKKHFQKMHKDVGMGMPKSIKTRCVDGITQQGRDDGV